MPQTVFDPAGRPTAGRVGLWWVPTIANVNAPTVAELNAGINITNAVYGFGDGATQAKVERRKYGYAASVQSFGRVSFAPPALEWDTDPQGTAVGTDYDYETTLVEGATGFLVHRRDVEPDDDFAAAQKVDVRQASLGYVARVDVGDTDGEMFRNRCEVIYGGKWADDVTVAAGA